MGQNSKNWAKKYKFIEENALNVTETFNAFYDTDVVALAINYFDQFLQLGLLELWVRFGTGAKVDSYRFTISFHHLVPNQQGWN